jgi:hypothetical protein
MIFLKQIRDYLDEVEKLHQVNGVYKLVSIEIPPETVIKETWFYEDGKRFHSIEFPASDLPFITKKMYDKRRYLAQKDEKTEITN